MEFIRDREAALSQELNEILAANARVPAESFDGRQFPGVDPLGDGDAIDFKHFGDVFGGKKFGLFGHAGCRPPVVVKRIVLSFITLLTFLTLSSENEIGRNQSRSSGVSILSSPLEGEARWGVTPHPASPSRGEEFRSNFCLHLIGE